MKKRLNQVVALSMVSALVLAACGTKEDTNTASPTPAGSPAANATPAAPAKEKLTLNWMVSSSPNATLPSGDKDFIRTTIEEKFNVEIKLDYLAMGPDYTNKLNALLAGGNSPDFFHADGAGSNKYIIDGAALDMTNYVTPAKMPNYFKWVSELELKRYAVQGKFMRAPVPFERNYYASYYVRKDWIDALNAKDPSLKLKVPTNYDEMIAVMKAFTFNDPDGNGKQDTYGFSATGNGNTIPADFPEWFKNGLTPGFFIDKDNNFIDSGTTLRMANVIDDIRKVQDMKVIDPDWFLNKAGDVANKVQSGKVGMFWAGGREVAFDNVPSSVLKKTRDTLNNPKIDFAAFHIAGDIPLSYEPLPGTPFLLGLKSDPKKIERTLEIMEWLASEEGFLLANFGKAGVHYTKEGKNIKIINDAFKKDIVDNGYFTQIWGAVFSLGVKDPKPLGLTIIDPSETDHDRAILEVMKKNTKLYVLGTNVAPPPGLDIGSYRTEMRKLQVKTLFDDKDSSNWPKYLDTLLTTYKAKEIFEAYATQVSTALDKKVVFSTK